MNDFFARLAARTLGKAPLAQPLRPSRFTDGGGLGVQELPLSYEEQPSEMGETPPGFQAEQPADVSVPTEGFSRAPSRGNAIFAGEPTSIDALGLEVPLPDQGFPFRPEQDSGFPEDDGLPQLGFLNQNKPDRSGQLPVRRNPPRLIEESLQTPLPSDAFQATKQRPSLAATPIEAAQPSMPEFLKTVERSSPPPKLIPSQQDSSSGWPQPEVAVSEPDPRNTEMTGPAARVATPLEAISWQTAQPPMPEVELHHQAIQESPPEIRVTIGRVEVRAVSEPARPSYQPPPPRKPSLSLNDYLKQRNENRK